MVHRVGSLCRDLTIPVSDGLLPARLVLPAAAQGLVIFVHGSGSSRHSRRNQQVAATLQGAGLATVLFDLLMAGEHDARQSNGLAGVDLPQLCQRVVDVLDGLSAIDPLGPLPLGLFGSSSGAALALAAASQRPQRVDAVVCRGGRPDLVPGVLGDVICPTLLLVGSHDLSVLELNTWAAAQLQGVHVLRVVPGAGHLFAEAGTLALVAQWSCAWFVQHLAR